ncbi:uncharacterized protein EV420DRAFT_1478757 [Desarmillaria tabescens]|uniref:CxC2-like cysteine cluster KDZ transposase-associated domain-containing protein n=1 Tax=Armillaria tabescens TaxID=1929756 RepID=A0AA39KFP3_ARMTA|nr:uncharacterized protein EV420DRAFT_1478757 [Desarmillaria tabescens]KAK0460240.1 hypothetical protein EV420DRAFT_1478757 [Desarmillaria tabescens]
MAQTFDIPPSTSKPSSDFGPIPNPGELHAFPDTSADNSPVAPPPKKTHVKDVEDEDDIVGPQEHFIQDFPWLAGDPIVERGKLPPFFELFRHQKVENGEAMWAPFSSRDEWELARWLMCSSISQKEIDSFLKLESIKNNVNPSFGNKRKLFQTIDKLPTGPEWTCEVFKIHGDLLNNEGMPQTEEIELWKHDPVACIRELMGDAQFKEHMRYAPERVYTDEMGTSRVYSEMATADWWWQIQKLLPKGVTIAPVILASDKTQLSHFSGDKSTWPVYLTIGNIDKDIRRKPSEHATVLIGYLPVSKLECFSKKQRSVESYQLFHTCMRSLLAPLIEAGKNGVEMLCTDGQTRLIYPILAAYGADYPEQCLIGCSMENRCPKCKEKAGELGDPVYSLMRDPKETVEVLKQASAGLEPQEFTDWGLQPVNPFWVDLPHCNIFQCFTPDILHQLHKGVFKDHVIKWATTVVNVDGPEHQIDGLQKAEVDCRFQAMTRHPSLRHFKKGISLISQWTGNEYKNMEKVFLSIMAGCVDEEVMKCIRAVLDFIYFAHYEEHTTESLKKLEDSWHTFHKHKEIFIDQGIRDHFNIPKIHSMYHYASMIHSHGSAGGYNMEASERLHIDYVKIAYNALNKKGYVKQMTAWMRRCEAVEKFQRFLQYAIDEYTEPEREDEVDGEEVDMDIDGSIDSHAGNDREYISHINPTTTLNNHYHDDNDDNANSKDNITTISQLEYGESTCFIPKTLSYTNVSLDDLQTKFGASEFVHAMEAFLHKHGLFSMDYWDAEPATYSVYKRFCVSIPPVPEVSQLATTDAVRATLPEPARGHKKATPGYFDTVLARKDLPEKGITDLDLLGPKGLHVAQIHAIFDLPPELGEFRHTFAYVEWFTPLCKVDELTRMFKVQYSTI